MAYRTSNRNECNIQYIEKKNYNNSNIYNLYYSEMSNCVIKVTIIGFYIENDIEIVHCKKYQNQPHYIHAPISNNMYSLNEV